MGRRPTLRDETGLSSGCRRALEHVGSVWYAESARKLTWELPGPRIGAVEPAEHSRDQDAPSGAGALSRMRCAMERVIERSCGLDVHKKTVTACVRIPGARGAREQHVRTFGTTAAELLALRDWLQAHGVTHVAMESTGVYWKPIFYVLEEAFTCVLANAAQIAQVPGRQTDVKDCAWIAQRLEHGLVRGSVVPPAPIRELRDPARAAAAVAHQHLKPEHPLEQPRPGPASRDALRVRSRGLSGGLRDNRGAPSGSRRQQPVIREQGSPRRRHERGEPFEQFQRIEAERGGAVAPRPPELVEHLPARALRQIDGWAVAEAIRGRSATMPIILITGLSGPEEMRRAGEQGLPVVSGRTDHVATDDAIDRLLNLRDVHRLRDHRERTDLERHGHEVRVGVPGHDHHRQGRAERMDLPEGLHAVHAGHREIEEDQIHVAPLHDLERLVAAAGGEDRPGLGREGGDHELPDRLLIVHDQDGGPAGGGMLAEPLVEDRLVEAPLAPDLVAREAPPLGQAIPWTMAA
jgi:Transposase